MTHAAPEPARRPDLLSLATDLLVAFVANAKVDPDAVPDVVAATYAAFARAGAPPLHRRRTRRPAPRQSENLYPTRGSFPSSTIGPYRTLKRHLAAYGHTPDSYRLRFGLPFDYPMVAPAYSAARSALAKANGLGRRPKPRAKPRRGA